MLLSLFALLATAGIAYVGAVHGPYRAAIALVALVIAGSVGFGLMGPLAVACGAENHDSVWYFAGDAFWLWAVTTVVFLVLRAVGERFLPDQSQLPPYIARPAGAVIGLATGYLVVGLGLVLLQMLPTAPETLGYEAFTYNTARRGNDGQPHHDSVSPTGSPLWLRWDSGTLAFFGYLSWCPLGPVMSEHSSLYDRYGDVYPPDRADITERYPAEGEYKGKLNTDDILYYHWYRRYEYIWWRVNRATGPMREPPRSGPGSEGLRLSTRSPVKMLGLALTIESVDRVEAIEGFSMRPSSTEDLVRVKIRMEPIGDLPRAVDTDQFVLLESDGNRVTRPHVMVRARMVGDKQYEISPESTLHAAVFQVREPQYAITPNQRGGYCLAEGARMRFSRPAQSETVTLVFSVTKRRRTDDLRLNVDAGPADVARWLLESDPKPPAEKK
jgi:hypothetical protein